MFQQPPRPTISAALRSIQPRSGRVAPRVRAYRMGRNFVVICADQAAVIEKARGLMGLGLRLISGPVLHENDWVAVLEEPPP